MISFKYFKTLLEKFIIRTVANSDLLKKPTYCDLSSDACDKRVINIISSHRYRDAMKNIVRRAQP